jgi:hypothetical protein
MADTTYLDFIDGVKSYYGSGSDQWAEIAKYGLKADNALNILKQVPDVEIIKNANGTVRGITYKGFTTMGGYSGGDTDKLNQILNGINSNTTGGIANPNKSFNMKIPSNTKVNDVTKELEMTSEIGKKVSTGKKVIGTLATIGQAVFAVGTACTLGKTIDKALYNLNPDFWNAHDMETLNPDTWAEITNSGSIGDNIFNALMGVDPDTNETTAYVDQNALAYMALYLQNKGIFNEVQTVNEITEDDVKDLPLISQYYNFPISGTVSKNNVVETIFTPIPKKETFTLKSLSKSKSVAFCQKVQPWTETKQNVLMYMLQDDDTVGEKLSQYEDSSSPSKSDLNFSFGYGTGNKSVFYGFEYTGSNHTFLSANSIFIEPKQRPVPSDVNGQLMWSIYYRGTEKEIGGIDGVGTQPEAIVPDLSGANSVNDVLNILKNTLPNIFNNAITNSVPQPDGSIKDYTYVPISLPNTNKNNDLQPETGNQTQAKPQVNPETSPDTLLDLIIKLIGTKLDTPNPPDTGTGNTPPVVLPTGSAEALYKIYNPSQAEINSFGAWLWSSNFVDQLLKVFNNPMESIIGLHKVYASPIIGGRSNIKVGYLDSGVSSNFVSNQYTKIDCGTVNLQEYFGNVFDYSPYTSIELYLPCIGFVQLDVGNVMRSSINITYTVDVLTGACLAEVNVKRDGYGGVLYSYSGNCASQYPLSSGSYMGIVSSVIGVAGSIVGTVASGGSLAPLALGATSGLLNAKTHVQRSGSLSGNSGVMGGKIPYLIITRPQTNMAENYQHLQGIPSNTYTQLSACHGFVKVKNVNVQNIIAESEEIEEIKTLLLDGVII